MITLGFIGLGNMGSAILEGIDRTSGRMSVFGYDVNMQKRSVLEFNGGIWLDSEREVVKRCKYIILACKPQNIAELLEKIKTEINSETVLVSLCAGISAGFLTARSANLRKVVLVMPNMPMLIGQGASAIARNEAVSDDEFDFVRGIIESCGISQEIPMGKLNEIICINASSPAFIYLFAQGFIEYAAEQGIDEGTARKLFAQTLVGSAKMLTDTCTSIPELIGQVASKGGTTEAGLEVFGSGGFKELIKNACEACTKRAYELGS